MAAVPLGLASFQRDDLPKVFLRNLYYESAPVNLEDQISLRPRPRLVQFGTPGAGPINGLYRKGGVLANVGRSGAIIAASGATLYMVNQTTGAATSIGAVTFNFSRMSAEGDPNKVVLTGGGALYMTDGATISTIALPDGFQAYAVDNLDSYYLITSDAGRFFWIQPGATTVDPLDFATAESQPDVLITHKVLGDELWLLGRLSIEVWQPTGDLNLPFQRINGRIFGIGITARDTCQKFNVSGIDTMCWVGTDRRVYRTAPNPVRISDAAIEEKLSTAQMSTSDNTINPYAATCSRNGHDFYILHIPGQGSFAYDLATQLWDEWTSYGHPHFRGAVSGSGPNSQPLFGDDTSNVIWQADESQNTDGPDPVVFEFTGLLEVPTAPVPCHNLSLDIATGTTTDPNDEPMIQMSWSDDMGETIVDAEPQSLGRMGERNLLVRWLRLGQLRRPGRLFYWSMTEPVTIRKAKYNESLRS